MRKLTLFLCFAILFSCSGDEAEMKSYYAEYIQAIQNNDSDFICQNLDSKTKKLYNEILSLTKFASKTRLSEANYFAKYQALILRQLHTKEEIQKLGWKDVCTISMKDFQLGASFENTALGAGKIQDDKAVYYLIHNGKKTKRPFFFVKENGKWIVNSSKLFAAIIQMTGSTSIDMIDDEVELVENQVANFAGDTLKPYIWIIPQNWPD